MKSQSSYSYGSTIDYADDLAKEILGRNAVYEDMLIRKLKSIGKEELIRIMKMKPIGKKIYAHISQSRWIACCDYCNGAGAVNLGGYFFCTTCLNFKNNNRSRPIVFPENYKDIETELMRRKFPKDRDWLIGEPIENLIIENIKFTSEGLCHE